MNTTVTEDSGTGRSQTQTVERNTELHDHDVILWCLLDTHSDPEESPSTVPALILMATPFS